MVELSAFSIAYKWVSVSDSFSIFRDMKKIKTNVEKKKKFFWKNWTKKGCNTQSIQEISVFHQ